MNVDHIDFIREYPLVDGYSILNAVIFASIFAAFFYIVLRKTSWMIRLGLKPLLLFFFLAVFRLVLPVEFPFSRIVGSQKILPGMGKILHGPLVHLGGYEIQVWSVLAFFWIASTVFLIGRLVWQWARYMRRMAGYPKAPMEMMQDLKQWLPKFHGEVRIAEGNTVPCVIGFFRPVILLPAWDYEMQNLRLVFLHEWQHFRNRDQWTKLLCYLLCCLLWWNPLMWMLKGKLDQFLEVRCDFGVLRKLEKGEQEDYYSMLLHAYRSSLKWSGPEGIPALARGHSHSGILQRFQMGENFSAMEKQSRKIGMVFSALIIAMFCLSYCVIIQQRDMGPEVAENGNQIHTGLPEGTYLTPNGDGTYTCHSGEESGVVEDITVEPFVSLPIVE